MRFLIATEDEKTRQTERPAIEIVGGGAPFVLTVVWRPLLHRAILASARDGRILVLVDIESPEDQDQIGVWHEFLHYLRIRRGHYLRTHHVEARIDAEAQQLAAVFGRLFRRDADPQSRAPVRAQLNPDGSECQLRGETTAHVVTVP